MSDHESAKGDGNGADEKIFSRIFDESIRTIDVISDVKSFGDLMISPKICDLLHKYQYYAPTPVQAKAIPLLMFGSDMLVQAKAGTGKTLVFAILSAMILHETEKTRFPQVLIVAPTREIAKQIYDTVRLFAPSNFWSGLFVGGTEVSANVELLKKGCQLAVGTCGRIVQLIKLKVLQLSKVQLLVLDEADELMDDDFVKQINYIFSMMQHEMKQICVFSATYPAHLEEVLKNYMRSPILLRLNVEGEQLVGVKEYCVFCDTLKKAEALLILLKGLIFNQCIIFCETLEFCGDVCTFLTNEGIECASLGSNLPQTERFQIVKKVKNGQVRVLVATNLIARGIDISGIDLVVNLAPAFDMETHMHRVGRAGRYGGRGIAITMMGNTKEAMKLYKLVRDRSLEIRTLDVCKDFPYDLVESGDDFYANATPFEKHPIITGDRDDDVSKALSSMSIQQKQSPTTQSNTKSASPETPQIPTPPTQQQSVPERARNRKIFYTRRDIAQIYASLSSRDWIQYACENLTIGNYSCITGVMYAHPELNKFAKDFTNQKQKPGSLPDDQCNVNQDIGAIMDEINKTASECLDQSLTPPPQTSAQRPECNVTEDERTYLKPFRPFRSIAQFRKIYAELNEQIGKEKSDPVPSVSPAPSISTALSASPDPAPLTPDPEEGSE